MFKKIFQKGEGGLMRRDLVTTSLSVIFGKGLGFLIPFFIAAVFGLNQQTDAFFFAYAVILVIQMVLGNVFETAVVPFITEQKAKSQLPKEFLGSILMRTSLFLAMIVLGIIVGGKPVMSQMVKFSPSTLQLSYQLMLIMVPMSFFIAWSSTFNGALNARKAFQIPALSPGFRSVVVLLFIFCFKTNLGIYAIAWGYLAGEALRCLVSYWAYKKGDGVLKLSWALGDEAKAFFKSASFQIIGLSVLCFVAVINQSMASHLGSGQLSLFTYGERLRNIPFMLFFSGFLPVIFSYWSNAYSRKDGSYSWAKNNRLILSLAGLSLIGAVILIGVRFFVAELAFGHGQFPAEKMEPVANIFAILIAAFVFDVVGLLSVRLLLIHRKDFLYMILAIGRLILVVILNYLLMQIYGIFGIAVSVVISNALYACVAYGLARHYDKSLS